MISHTEIQKNKYSITGRYNRDTIDNCSTNRKVIKKAVVLIEKMIQRHRPWIRILNLPTFIRITEKEIIKEHGVATRMKLSENIKVINPKPT